MSRAERRIAWRTENSAHPLGPMIVIQMPSMFAGGIGGAARGTVKVLGDEHTLEIFKRNAIFLAIAPVFHVATLFGSREIPDDPGPL